MAPEEAGRARLGRKLTKLRRDPHKMSFDVPDRFKDGEDAQDDVTAPKGADTKYMNQSIFSMIAAAGSKVDFQSRFDEESSEGENDPEEDRSLSGTASPSEVAQSAHTLDPSPTGKHRRRLSEQKLLRSLPRLGLRTGRHKEGHTRKGSSTIIASPSGPEKASTYRIGDATVMSRMLEAQAQYNTSALRASVQETEGLAQEDSNLRPAVSLETRLMEIFELDAPEDVISEYPCWLLKSVLLQGYMYITTKHICFYAYLPKKSHVVAKSGYLSKRGRQNPKYNRYWFTLKGDVLSYYADPSDLYFPSGNIDLRYGISASLVEQKEKGKRSTAFTVTTHQRTYYFKADSAASAKEWVKNLQKVIFRSHNDGDSVKISLPIENVIDIEDSSVIDFAETCKIRVVDNDETYAIDEYFFSFFSFGREALNVLRLLVDDTPAQKIPEAQLSLENSAHELRVNTLGEGLKTGSPGRSASPVIRESVRRTLSPLSPPGDGRISPRVSGDWGRSSFDTSRRSFDANRELRRASSERPRHSESYGRMSTSKDRDVERSRSFRHVSSESFAHSVDHETNSSEPAVISRSNFGATASQILDRSDVFQSPTIQVPDIAADPSLPRPKTGNLKSGAALDKQRRTSHQLRLQQPPKPDRSRSTQRYANDSESGKDDPDESSGQTGSAPALQDFVRAGTYPLQRAAGLAGYLKNRSRHMSNLLATESMGYLEKVSGMWTGGRKHYSDAEEPVSNDRFESAEEEEEEATGHGDRFRAHFTLPSTEKLQATYFGYLHRVLPLYGKIYISNMHFCFRSLLPGTRTKLILPLKDIENVEKEKGFRFGYSGLVIVIRGHEELFFEFSQQGIRDDCTVTLLLCLETTKHLRESGLLSQQEKDQAEAAKAEHRMLQQARQVGHNDHEVKLPSSTNDQSHVSETPLILFDDPRASIINFKPTESLRITCLTIGSRGDVQPYIAFCKGLLAEGHKPKIATHLEFEPWVRKHGIDFAPIDGDPAELMRICVENGMFTYSFLKEASTKFRGWIDELLASAWKACQDTDLLIESPSAMAGIHIAEALQIPYFRAFTMPWTRTRAYPHAFAVPEHKMGGAYNYFTYVMFDNVFWKAIAGQVNRWRKRELGLPRTSLDKLQPNKVPFLYNFSPSVVVPPLDYSDWIRVTGYWFLDEASGWEPPKELTDFIQQARADGKKIVYVGFGSIVVSDSAALTKTVIDSVMKADVRCILSKGWSDRLDHKGAHVAEMPLPKEIHQIKSAPHDWLFKQIDAAAHHGGAGTTGASLRAGLPTIIKPFFGDQFFFGSRVEDLGVGIYVKKLNVSVFSRALWEATHSERMIAKAKVLGEQIRKEDGVNNAIQAVYRDMKYAKTLIKKHDVQAVHAQEESEESWTFIGDESDPELAKRIADWDPAVQLGPGSRYATTRKTAPPDLAVS